MLKTILRTSLAAAALAVMSVAAYAAGPASTGQTAKGPALVDAKGMTLYTYAKDMNGMSMCTGGCAKNWPPLMATDAGSPPAGWTVVNRDDGSKQWAFQGHPLYTFIRDQKPGDANGQGLASGAWQIAKP